MILKKCGQRNLVYKNKINCVILKPQLLIYKLEVTFELYILKKLPLFNFIEETFL